jgi:hypothetical protein
VLRAGLKLIQLYRLLVFSGFYYIVFLKILYSITKGTILAYYLVEGAVLQCTNGTKNSKLVVTSQNTVWMSDKLCATVQDCAFLPFGECTNKDSKTCTPECSGWSGGKKDLLISGNAALMDKDEALCTSGGGMISVVNSGQDTL